MKKKKQANTQLQTLQETQKVQLLKEEKEADDLFNRRDVLNASSQISSLAEIREDREVTLEVHKDSSLLDGITGILTNLAELNDMLNDILTNLAELGISESESEESEVEEEEIESEESEVEIENDTSTQEVESQTSLAEIREDREVTLEVHKNSSFLDELKATSIYSAKLDISESESEESEVEIKNDTSTQEAESQTGQSFIAKEKARREKKSNPKQL